MGLISLEGTFPTQAVSQEHLASEHAKYVKHKCTSHFFQGFLKEYLILVRTCILEKRPEFPSIITLTLLP